MAESRIQLVAALGAGVVLGRAIGTEQAAFARLAGWTIAAPDAAGWVTDFLNAAYYRRPADERDVEDLRLAFAIVTSHWASKRGRRLRLTDVLDFHRAYGRRRLIRSEHSPRGTLAHEQLLAGAARLFGDWFADAYTDDERRGWGIVFRTPDGKRRHRPQERLDLASVGELTPPTAPPEHRAGTPTRRSSWRRPNA